MLNTDNELIRERIQEDRLQNSRTTTFCCEAIAECQRSRIYSENREPPESTCSPQRDLQQSQSFNPFSQESKQMTHEVGNIELCELLDTEPKTQCKVCLHTGTSALSTARAGTSCEKEQRWIRNSFKYTMDPLCRFPTTSSKKGRPHGHRYGKKPGDKEYYVANQLKKKCKKRCFQGIHDRFIRDDQFRSRTIWKWSKRRYLSTNGCSCGRRSYPPFDPTRIFSITKVIGGSRSNKTGSDTMPVQRRSDFK